MYFTYGRTEVEYLKGRDKILAAVIDKVGHVDREVDTDKYRQRRRQQYGRE